MCDLSLFILPLGWYGACEIKTIPQGCPCRIEITYPRGWNFNQGRGLLRLWLNSDTEGEISLSCMDWSMLYSFLNFSNLFFGT